MQQKKCIVFILEGHRQGRDLAKGDEWQKWTNMYVAYILKSDVRDRFYVGYTNNLTQRLRHHNSGSNKSTRPYRPWIVIHSESFPDKKSAWLREQQIKRYKGGEAFKKLIIK